MATMTDAEYRQFMSEGTRTAKIATVRADGRPHVAPVWFILDGDGLVFTTGADTVKGKALLRDPRLALCVEDDTPPFSFVLIEGTATVTKEPDSGEMLDWATRIAARYMGADRADAYGKRNAVPGEMLVRVTPTKVLAEKDIAD